MSCSFWYGNTRRGPFERASVQCSAFTMWNVISSQITANYLLVQHENRGCLLSAVAVASQTTKTEPIIIMLWCWLKLSYHENGAAIAVHCLSATCLRQFYLWTENRSMFNEFDARFLTTAATQRHSTSHLCQWNTISFYSKSVPFLHCALIWLNASS